MTSHGSRCARYQEHYIARGPIGVGFSESSRRQMLRAAVDRFLASGQPAPPEEVLTLALSREQTETGQEAIAAADGCGIAYGGAQIAITRASSAEVRHETVRCDPQFIQNALVWGYRPNCRKHRAGRILEQLFGNPCAAQYVAEIAALTDEAAQALRQSSVGALADAVNSYREVFFERWASGCLRDTATEELAKRLRRKTGRSFGGFKYPGAGGVSAIIVVTEDSAMTLRVMREEGWLATRARVMRGLRFDWRFGDPGWARFVAPARLDITAGADLGADHRIGADGRCLALAIAPSAELRFTCSEPPSLANHSIPERMDADHVHS
jgi:hypothetical protein